MKLYTFCSKCKNEISFCSTTHDRVELAGIKGKEIELICSGCGLTDAYHVNRIRASERKIPLLTILVILFIGTPLALIWVWESVFRLTNIYAIARLVGVIGVPYIIYSVIELEHRKKVKKFNSYKLSE